MWWRRLWLCDPLVSVWGTGLGHISGNEKTASLWAGKREVGNRNYIYRSFQIAACPGPGSSLFPNSSYQNWSKQLRVLWTHCRDERGRPPSGRGNSAGTRQKDILSREEKKKKGRVVNKFRQVFVRNQTLAFLNMSLGTCTLHDTLSTQAMILIPDTAFTSGETDSRWITLYRRKYFNRNIIIVKLALKFAKNYRITVSGLIQYMRWIMLKYMNQTSASDSFPNSVRNTMNMERS